MNNFNQSQADFLNESSLKILARAIELSQEEFSLNLARCNYANLRDEMVERLRELCSVEIQELYLQESAKTLYTEIQNKLSEKRPHALMVFGLELVTDIDRLLDSTNRIREEFSKNFKFPIILWVNDTVLRKISQIAPDFKNWAAIPVEFIMSVDELKVCLENSINKVFNTILKIGDSSFSKSISLNQSFDFRYPEELGIAARELQSSDHPLSCDLDASLTFLQGQVKERCGEKSSARQYYEDSLRLWSKNLENDKSPAAIQRLCCVMFYLGLWWRQYVPPHRAEYQGACRRARNYFHQCVRTLQQAQYNEVSAKFINAWGEVLVQLVQLDEQVLDELNEVSQTAISLHQEYYEPVRLAYAYSLMSEVALSKSDWYEAKRYAELALETHEKPSISNPNLKWERQHHKNFYLLLLAKAQHHINQTKEAIANLQLARTNCNSQYDPLLYIQILDALRQMYVDQKEYLKAFGIKELIQATKQQYGFLAFVGAGRLRPSKIVIDPVSVTENNESIAKEIIASGRKEELDLLIRRILDRTDCPLTILYGPSGVGKSSIIQAGLIPALPSYLLDTRNLAIVPLQVYTNWIEDLGQSLVETVQKLPSTILPDYSPASTLDILRELQNNTFSRNLTTILVFDQFEEFFFICKEPDQRKCFYEFVDACLEIGYVKVVLSIREDYLHLILECNDRLVNLKKFNNVLHKDTIFYLKNLTSEDAKSVIQALTEGTQIAMEPKLVDRLVQDLAGKYNQVRPIELQILGSQLQAEKITTLEEYFNKGSKNQIFNEFLKEVVRDCGSENEQVAGLILYLLTNEDDTRSIKTRAELAQDLEAIGLDSNSEVLDLVLTVLVGSGIILRLLEASAERYQLVHDYLVPLIRRQENLGLHQQLEERLNRELTEQELIDAKKQTEGLLLEVQQRQQELDQERKQLEEERRTNEQNRIRAMEALRREVQQRTEQVEEDVNRTEVQNSSINPLFLKHRFKIVEDCWETVLRQESGQDLIALLNQLRNMGSPEGQATTFISSQVLPVIENLDLNEAIRAARAFVLYFQLINIVEQHYEQRNQQLQYQASGEETDFLERSLHENATHREIGTFRWLFSSLRKLNVPPPQIQRLINQLDVRLVFTAHPTEIVRNTIRDKQRRIAKILRELDRVEDGLKAVSLSSSWELESLYNQLTEEIRFWWGTDELHQYKPTALDEVDHVLQYFQEVLFDVTPSLHKRFYQALKDTYPALHLPKHSLCKFGSWAGADRDGNPSVTPEATWKSVCYQRIVALKMYIQSIKHLISSLSLSLHWVDILPDLFESLEQDQMQLSEVYDNLAIRYRQEPYRLKLSYIQRRLENTLERTQQLYNSSYVQAEYLESIFGTFYNSEEDFLAELKLVQRNLEMAALACQGLNDLICRVEAFGFNLVYLDIKQKSSVHTEAIDEITAHLKVLPNRYTELSEEQRMLWLSTELQTRRPLGASMLPLSEKTSEVLQTFRMIYSLQKEFGYEVCQTYVTARCSRATHVLEVLLLAKEAQLYNSDTGASTLQVVPAFESAEELKQSPTLLSKLLELPFYRALLERKQVEPDQEQILLQELLISYSFSNKELGFLSSNWEIHKAQQALQRVAEKYRITLRILHERGGAIERGGGLAYESILAQPGCSADGRIKITEQGEVLASKYGWPEVALYNLETVITAVIQSSLLQTGFNDIQPWNEILEELAARSFSAYRNLVYEQSAFADFFHQVTPIEEICQFQISSRPSKKTSDAKIIDLEAIPWAFSWNQSRFSLPAWYGMGIAFQSFLERDPEKNLKLLRYFYYKWPFFKCLVSKCEMSLAKVDLQIAARYVEELTQPERQEQFEQIFNQIVTEYCLVRDLILAITEHKRLLDNYPSLQQAVQMRNPTLASAGLLQVTLLKRLRAHKVMAASGIIRSRYSRGELLRGVLLSIDANAAGLQMTG